MCDRILITSLFCIVLAVSHAMAQTSLMETWQDGEEFSYTIEDKYSISSGTSSLNQSLELDTHWHVQTMGVDGGAVITVQIERVRFKTDKNGFPASFNEFSFDSQHPVEAQSKGEASTFNALNAFVGSQMSITINEKREVSKFELSEPLAAHLERNHITIELAGAFGHTFTTNGMRRRLTNWLVASPSKPVSKGETWHREQDSRYEDFFVCVDTYTLEGPAQLDGQTLTKIDVKTELKLPDNNNTGKEFAKIAKQSGGGRVLLDQRTRRVVDATLRYQIAEESKYAPGSIDTTITAKLLANPKL